MAKVAFLGTGIMGCPMAINLVKAGFEVTAWNRTLSKTDPIKEAGGSVAQTPPETVKDADYILSILDSGSVVREVFFDTKAHENMKSGAVFIDMASIPPKMVQEHAAWLKEKGVGHLDAPIRNFVKDLNTVLDTAGELNVKLPIVEAVRDVFQNLYDKGMTQYDHSAFLLYLEELNKPVRLGTGEDIPPE